MEIPSNLDTEKLLYTIIVILVYFFAQRVTIKQLKSLLHSGENNFRKFFKNQVANAEKINALLDLLILKLNADRAYVFQYHNGGSNIAGIPFAKCSNTHERCEIGIKPHIHIYQNLPLAMYGFRNNTIASGEMIEIYSIDDLFKTDKSAYSFFLNLEIKSIYVIGLFTVAGVPIGFIGIDYVRDQKKLDKKQLERIKTISQRVSGFLENIGQNE